MTNEMRLDAVNEAIGEIATDIAQAYAEFGDLTSMFLGQTSSNLQLRLFRPLALETSLFVCSLLPNTDMPIAEQVLSETREYASELGKPDSFFDESLSAYDRSSDKPALFIKRCQDIVAMDSLWLSTQRQDAQPQQSISDKGFVAIQKGAKRLQGLVALLS